MRRKSRPVPHLRTSSPQSIDKRANLHVKLLVTIISVSVRLNMGLVSPNDALLANDDIKVSHRRRICFHKSQSPVSLGPNQDLGAKRERELTVGKEDAHNIRIRSGDMVSPA